MGRWGSVGGILPTWRRQRAATLWLQRPRRGGSTVHFQASPSSWVELYLLERAGRAGLSFGGGGPHGQSSGTESLHCGYRGRCVPSGGRLGREKWKSARDACDRGSADDW